jgi:hypothetical protein
VSCQSSSRSPCPCSWVRRRPRCRKSTGLDFARTLTQLIDHRAFSILVLVLHDVVFWRVGEGCQTNVGQTTFRALAHQQRFQEASSAR